jgi:hypothetical protein
MVVVDVFDQSHWVLSTVYQSNQTSEILYEILVIVSTHKKHSEIVRQNRLFGLVVDPPEL